MAVMKARVASILPIMRRWYDGMAEYKLRTGSYFTEDDDSPDGSEVGANWPSDWKDGKKPCEDSNYCTNGTWLCTINGNDDGSVYCGYRIGNSTIFEIYMNQHDGSDICGGNQGKTICAPISDEGEKICKSLGKPSGTEGGLQCTQIGG